MLRVRGTAGVCLVLVWAAGCESAPTAPASEPGAPSFVVTRDRQEFSQPVVIPVPSPCLGGTFTVAGTISGWFQVIVTPNGHVQVTEHIDFSQLTASFDGRSWTAQPGSVEIWSRSLAPLGDAARVVVHEGRTRFVADDGAGPGIMFVHRIHQLRLPNGDVLINDIVFEAFCRGSSA
jgi:hypothetical protein